MSDLLRLGLETKPEEVAILSNRRALTWAELEDASSRVAAGYLGLGLRAGDRVASLMPNRVDLVVHYLACFKAELIATPLNYRYTATEIDHALGVSGARALLAHEERAADVAASELAPGLELGTIAYRDAEPLPQGNDEPDAEAGWAGDLIVHCRERIAYKAPEEIVFLDEMPLNPTGKIDRAGLKRMAEDHLHPHGL